MAVIANVPIEVTPIPPSFDGDHMLQLVNLFVFTTGFAVFLLIAIDLTKEIYRERAIDKRRHPATVWRLIIVSWALGFAIRCGLEAAVLWGWKTEYAISGSPEVVLKRLLDPVAFLLGGGALVGAYLARPGIIVQLRNKPFPMNFWTAIPMLKRPAGIALCCLVGSLGMVFLRYGPV